MCQGNFAAIVKEILPINEYSVLAAATSTEHCPREPPRVCGNSSLTGWRFLA